MDLSNILCIRDKRTILNGNMISWNNNYYQILDKDNSIKQIYKGTEITVYQNVLTKVVRVKYYNIFYETKQVEGHRQDPVKKEQLRIDNQKQLEQVLRDRDEKLKARGEQSEFILTSRFILPLLFRFHHLQYSHKQSSPLFVIYIINRYNFN